MNQLITTPSFFVGSEPGQVPATTGDNVITLQRESSGNRWMQFDYVRLETIPEPATGLSLAAGTLLLGLMRRRQR